MILLTLLHMLLFREDIPLLCLGFPLLSPALVFIHSCSILSRTAGRQQLSSPCKWVDFHSETMQQVRWKKLLLGEIWGRARLYTQVLLLLLLFGLDLKHFHWTFSSDSSAQASLGCQNETPKTWIIPLANSLQRLQNNQNLIIWPLGALWLFMYPVPWPPLKCTISWVWNTFSVSLSCVPPLPALPLSCLPVKLG